MFFNLFVAAAILIPTVPIKQIGKPARDFRLMTLSGQPVSLSEMKGNVVLMNFWATWCSPCRQELPELSRLQEKYRQRGFVVAAVNVDNKRENAEQFLKQNAIKIVALWDKTKKVATAYNVEAMPSSYLIDRHGVLRAIHKGFHPEALKKIEAELEVLLDE